MPDREKSLVDRGGFAICYALGYTVAWLRGVPKLLQRWSARLMRRCERNRDAAESGVNLAPGMTPLQLAYAAHQKQVAAELAAHSKEADRAGIDEILALSPPYRN
jgi:hypothetical protein